MLAIILVLVFVVLALVHGYWAMGGPVGKQAAVPEAEGKPLFLPTPFITLLVGLGLLLMGGLVAGLGGLVHVPLSSTLLVWLGYGVALIFLLRAIGDFRWVGFFKRVRNTRFAHLDTYVYSPLCLFLAGGVFWVTQSYGG